MVKDRKSGLFVFLHVCLLLEVHITYENVFPELPLKVWALVSLSILALWLSGKTEVASSLDMLKNSLYY